MPRKRKPPWNHDLKIPGYGDEPPHVVTPSPETVSVGHSTSAHLPADSPPDSGVTSWECGRCLWLAEGRPGEEIPEHAPRCVWRGRGDPEPSG
jgi:hypothetical protein